MIAGCPNRSAESAGGAAIRLDVSHPAMSSAKTLAARAISPPFRSSCVVDRATDSLAVPSGDHVPIDHVTHDPRNECVASRLGREPALPLELVQRLGQRFPGDARALPAPRPGDPAPAP